MKTLWFRPTILGILIFFVIFWTIQPTGAITHTAMNWNDMILSPNSEMDLKQVIRTGVPDLENQIRQYMKDNIEKLKQFSKELEDDTGFGVKAGMTYEITLAGTGETGKVSMEYDILDLVAWDGRSDLPVKLKIEKENVGAIEVQYDPSAPIGIKEIKVEKKMPGGVVSQSGTLTIAGTWEQPEVQITYGQKAETPTAGGFKGEAEQTIGIDFDRSADDLYDPEWNPRSESMVVRGIEELIAKTTWGVKVSGKKEIELGPGEKITTGIDVSAGTDAVRSAWTDWLFKDMYEAYDQLDEQLDNAAAWRRKKIEEEALHLGLNPEGKTNAQLINEIQAVWNKHPELRRPIFRVPKPPATEVSGGGTISGGGTSSGGGAGAGWDDGPGVPIGDGKTHTTDSPGVSLVPDPAPSPAPGTKTGDHHPASDQTYPGYDAIYPGWNK
jgi:hypothetical protein